MSEFSTFLQNFSINSAEHATVLVHLKQMFVERLNIDRDPADIPDNEPIFTTGLQLDSVDALEIIVNIERMYKIKFKEYDLVQAEENFKTISSVADFVLLKVAEKEQIDLLTKTLAIALESEKPAIEAQLKLIDAFIAKQSENIQEKLEKLKQKYTQQ